MTGSTCLGDDDDDLLSHASLFLRTTGKYRLRILIDIYKHGLLRIHTHRGRRRRRRRLLILL